MFIQIQKMSETAKVPTQGSDKAAGYDLYADITEPVTIAPFSVAKIPTGIAMAIPSDHFGAIYARSGLALKQGLRPAQGTAVIDADYRGQIFVPLYNQTDTHKTVAPQERIAQIVFQQYSQVQFTVTDQLDDTERGNGGFGSTGTH